MVLWLAACAPEAPPPALDPRTQYDLLADVVRAGAEHDHHAVRAAWAGRRVQWEVLRVPELCRDAACNVVPFDGRRATVPQDQGWLPRLTLDDAASSALAEACAPHDPCVFTFEGTLTTLRLDAQELTRVGFDDVHVLSARSPRPDETWGQRHPAGRGDLDAVQRRAEELRAKGFVPTLTPRGG